MSAEETGDHMENGQPIETSHPPGAGSLSAEEHRAMMEARPKAEAFDPNANPTLGDVVREIQRVSNRPKSPSPGAHVEIGTVLVNAKYVPNLGLDPRVITSGVDASHVGYIQPVADAFSHLYEGLKQLSDAREAAKGNDAWTEANQILVVAEAAEKLMDRSTRQFDNARKRLTENIKTLDDSLSKSVTTDASHPLSREVREYVSKLPSDKRMGFLNEALKKNDLKTLHAVLGAQPFLSGITDEMQVHFTRTLHEHQQPEIAQRVQIMRKTLEKLEQRSGLIFKEIEKCLGAKFDTVQKLRKAKSKAEAALLLLNNPVTP